jgi:hypothetical protein
MKYLPFLFLLSLEVGCGDRATLADLGPTPDRSSPDGAGISDAGPPEGSTPVPLACTSPEFNGTLCGPPEEPCSVLLDETVSGQDSFRNDPPTMVIAPNDTPLVLFALPRGGYHGYLAHRGSGGKWAVSHLPMDVASGSLTCTKDGYVDLLADDGAFGVTHWTAKGDSWKLVETVPAKEAFAHGFAQDPSGVFHASVKVGNNADTVAYARRDPTWGMRSVGDSFYDAPLALSPSGKPYVASWQRTDSGTDDWKLVLSGATSDETVTTSQLDSSDNLSFLIALAVVAKGADETPYLMFKKSSDPSQSSDLTYAHPSAAGTWTLGTIATDGSPTQCTHEPSYNGEKCSYDFLKHQPLAAVATTSGELRLLFARRRFFGDLVSTCYGDSGAGSGGGSGGAPADAGAGSADAYSPPTGCHWNGAGTTESRLEMAWLTSAGVERVTLVDKLDPWDTASAMVDSLGRIHVALYAYSMPSSDLVLRYLLIGSAS